MCELCLKSPCMDPRCPNYIPKKAQHYCSLCENGIYDGEEYIENQDGEYRHYECYNGMKDLLEWLGFDIKTMEDTYE